MKKAILILAIATVLLLVTATTLAWLVQQNTVTFPTSFGSTHSSAYFAGGDGTETDPYLITSPVHLYNLAWLQYLGYFNMGDGFNNAVAQNYFSLQADIDMQGMALPPIGTEEYPFIGNFNGNDHIIEHLTVSNSQQDLTQSPTNAKWSGGVLQTADNADVAIVGLFGVAGNYQGYATEYIQTHGTDHIQAANMSVSGFYIDRLSVKSSSAKTLVGLVAGYVGADVKNTGVYRCSIAVDKTSTGLDGYDTTVSKYTVVGDYDSATVSWKELESIGGAGNDAAWGGSIDMRTLNRRITYMMAKVGEVETAYKTTAVNENFGINIRRQSNAEFYWNTSDTNSYQYVYLNEGTVLPLNVDKNAMGLNLDASTEIEVTKSGGNGAFHYNEYYQTNTKEKVGDKNTGYIVSKGNSTTSYIRPRIQPLAGSNDGGIFKSLGYSEVTAVKGALSYDEAHQKKMEMLTVAFENGGYYTYRIKDHINAENTGTAFSSVTQKHYSELGFTGYHNVRDEFDKTMAGAYVVHGLHFQISKSQNYGLSETDYSTVKKTVQLYNSTTDKLETIDNYPLMEGGINFTVSEAGSIKAVLGTFFGNGSTGNSMFDLYKVERESTATGGYSIKSVTRISKIYKDSNGNVVYNPTDTTGLTLVFDFDAVTQSDILQKYAAYYFEIPVTAGDYVIGADVSSSANNAYLMYLDIGANGNAEEGGTTTDYSISCVDFVSPNESGTLQKPSKDGYGNYSPAYDDVVFHIAHGAGTDGAVLSFKRENWSGEPNPIQTKVLWWCEGTATVTPLPSEMATNSQAAQVETEAARGREEGDG